MLTDEDLKLFRERAYIWNWASIVDLVDEIEGLRGVIVDVRSRLEWIAAICKRTAVTDWARVNLPPEQAQMTAEQQTMFTNMVCPLTGDLQSIGRWAQEALNGLCEDAEGTEIARLRTALECYTDATNWEPDVMEPNPVNGLMHPYVEEPSAHADAGDVVREALGVGKGGNECPI